MRKSKLLEMSDKETVMDMYSWFTHIINELKSLGKTFTSEELIRNNLRFLPQSWEPKVITIQEAKKMVKSYELRKNGQVKKDRDLVLKALESEGSGLNDEEIVMVARRVTKLLKKVGWQLKKGSTSKARNSDPDKVSGCFKYGKHAHVVKNCPLQNEEQGLEQF